MQGRNILTPAPRCGDIIEKLYRLCICLMHDVVKLYVTQNLFVFCYVCVIKSLRVKNS